MTRLTAESRALVDAHGVGWNDDGTPSRDAILLLAVRAPQRRALALLRIAAGLGLGEERLLWVDPLGHESVAGVGAAVEIAGRGATRFRDVAIRANHLWRHVRRVQRPDTPQQAIRLFGGFSFRPEHAKDPPWERFGDARFLLPRLLYQDQPGGTALTLAVPRGMADDADGQRRFRVQLQQIADALEHAPADEPSALAVRRAQVIASDLGEQGWTARVERARQQIVDGRLEKVVVARRADLRMLEPIDVHQVLAALLALDPGCTLFALGWEDTMFVGATPERLVAKRGLELTTEALAGSCGSFGPAAVAALQGSLKDLCEHELVVRELRRSLEPLCVGVRAAARPEVRTLRHVMHLHTPVTAMLRKRAHVLELVERLHPTPAVGGVPVDAAVEWLAREEPALRGWYASPIGWFDANGDGRFAMALRSGVLTGHCAYLFAGAGIVRQSDAASEFEETRLKLQSLVTALGVAP